VLHAKGGCRPCAWFWKPESCLNGKDCGHCHLCPEGELKLRKKLKQRSRRSTSLGQYLEQEGLHGSSFALDETVGPTSPNGSDHTSTAEASSECDFTPSTVQDSEKDHSESHEEPLQPSATFDISRCLSVDGLTPGSALHGSGNCKPCAWFWKPSGCQRGQACMYCHLCPEGELKLRKKAKHAQMRSENSDASPSAAAGAGVRAAHPERRPLGLADLL